MYQASLNGPGAAPVWAVGALCQAIADSLQARFNPVQVRGEIAGFSRAPSGHCYFSIKDATGQLRPQPTFALLHRSLAPSPADFLQQGGHKIGQWAQEQGRILCPFDQATDHPLRSFVNINTLAELQTLE